MKEKALKCINTVANTPIRNILKNLNQRYTARKDEVREAKEIKKNVCSIF